MKLFVYLRAIIAIIVESVSSRKRKKPAKNKRTSRQRLNSTQRKDTITLPPNTTLSEKETDSPKQEHPSQTDSGRSDLGTIDLIILPVDPDITTNLSKDETLTILPTTDLQNAGIEHDDTDDLTVPDAEDLEMEPVEFFIVAIQQPVLPVSGEAEEPSFEKESAENIMDPVVAADENLDKQVPVNELDLLSDEYSEELDNELSQISLFNFDVDQIDEDDDTLDEGESTQEEEFFCHETKVRVDTTARMEADTPRAGQHITGKKVSKKTVKCPFHRNSFFLDVNYSDGDTDKFLRDLENDELESIWLLPVDRLEGLFVKALQRYQFIGDLPLSRRAYEGLADYERKNSLKKREIHPRYSSPAIFAICMVFCARYAETEAREFWRPYAQQVWKSEPSQYFMNVCRQLFVYSRGYLSKHSGLSFDYIRTGDVVRPIYQHAIIPSYLQDHFVDWLVDHFESLMPYSVGQLPKILQYEKSLDHVPPRLKEFIRGEDTSQTAARLIVRMSSAIQLFNELGKTEAVESVINSVFEKSLWNLVYRRLIQDASKISILRKTTPKLDWRWDLDREEVFLHLSNIRSDKSTKPDSVVWCEKGSEKIKENDCLIRLSPWPMAGAWELDPVEIRGEGPQDGDVLVLSANYDIDQPKDSQTSEVIFEREVPQLQKPLEFFQIYRQGKIGIWKDQIDANGTWIFLSMEEVSVTDDSGDQIPAESISLPYQLRARGFSQAQKIKIQLPVTIQWQDNSITFEQANVRQDLNPVLRGNEKIPNMSAGIPKIFRSPNIDFEFSVDPDLLNLRRTWLLLRRNGEYSQSILLADLVSKEKLIVEENFCVIDLSDFLDVPGAYSINLFYDMKALLDEAVHFAWLPEEIKITGPSSDVCYSPVNPLRVTIEGVPEEQVIPYQDEKFKKVTKENVVQIEWRILKEPKCRFDMSWDGYPIHFCWDVDRVAAWIDGGGDKNQVIEDQEQDVVVQVRGKPEENYSWAIDGIGERRYTKLEARRGELEAKLIEHELRDMLQESTLAKSTVTITIRDQNWALFDFRKEPQTEITNVDYQKSKLHISFNHGRKLHGAYSIQVRDINSLVVQELFSIDGMPEDQYSLQSKLEPGEYQVDMHLFENLLCSSATFSVQGQVTQADVLNDYDSLTHVFYLLTQSRQEYLKQTYEKSPVASITDQLKLIHTPEEWVVNKGWNEGFVRLLPSWAVLNYPLRFVTKIHSKVLHVFPEKVAFGGRAGRGYAELKIRDEKVKVSASWRPEGDGGLSRLWMGISPMKMVRDFCTLDEYDLWPAYQCKECGTFVALKDGTYYQFPPSFTQLHKHGKDLRIQDVFVDTVYDEKNKVLVDISQYEDETLSHSFLPKDIVFPRYLLLLIDEKTRPKKGSLQKPIDMDSDADFGVAISDLYLNLDTSAIQQFLTYSSKIERFSTFINTNKRNIPAFQAMHRLLPELNNSTHPSNVPAQMLNLAMTLRMKPTRPDIYAELLSSTAVTEKDISEIVNHAAQGCPKLLEWCIAWAELFYVHAIS